MTSNTMTCHYILQDKTGALPSHYIEKTAEDACKIVDPRQEIKNLLESSLEK